MKLVSVKHAVWGALAMFAWFEAGAWIIYSLQEEKPPLVPYFLGMSGGGFLLSTFVFFVVRISVDKIWRTLFVLVSVGVVASLLQVLMSDWQGKVEFLSLLEVLPWACGFIGLWVSRNEPFWKNIKPKRRLHD